MNISEHNKTSGEAKPSITSIGDLRDFVRICDVPNLEKTLICSALKRADELVGHGNLDLKADLPEIIRRLSALTPELCNMSKGSFANLKSRVRAAFRLGRGNIKLGKSWERLSVPWAEMYAALDEKTRRKLSRLFHYASRERLQPSDVDDELMALFTAHVRDEAGALNWEEVNRDTIRNWNHALATGPFEGLKRLTPPDPKRTAYWIAEEGWPASLREDVGRFFADLEKPPIFTDKRFRVLKATTVGQYRATVATLIGAAVGRGVPLSSVVALSDLVKPDTVNRALMFLVDRHGGQVTRQMGTLAARARVIAEWCGVPESELQQLRGICRSVDEQSGKKRGMVDKNRALLDRLDDQRFHDLVLTLPNILLDKAKVHRNAKWGAAMARNALAIDLLLTCSMRRENLVSLRLGESIKRIGLPPNRMWIVEIAPQEVKNGQPLRYELPTPTAEMLEAYLANWRPKLCRTPNDWLFPGPQGEKMGPTSLAEAIKQATKRVIGVPITPHQFRHISAESYLKDYPDSLQTMSQHLGHRDPNTTATYYARPKQREATRRYQERVLLKREAAEHRTRPVRKIRISRANRGAEDLL